MRTPEPPAPPYMLPVPTEDIRPPLMPIMEPPELPMELLNDDLEERDMMEVMMDAVFLLWLETTQERRVRSQRTLASYLKLLQPVDQ